MFPGVLDRPLRPLIDWYRCRALTLLFKIVGLTPHPLYQGPFLVRGRALRLHQSEFWRLVCVMGPNSQLVRCEDA